MLNTSIPSYILDSGLAAQRSRTRNHRLSQASEASMWSMQSSDEEPEQPEAPLQEIKEVLGYVHTSRGWTQRYDTPRLVHF
ncbi:hypothetical protein EV183_001429 [Coemansia sp. RSA 2336]|nr:hypothetical protein EV183_001429 [Coemansia sp. RSA 2336]